MKKLSHYKSNVINSRAQYEMHSCFNVCRSQWRINLLHLWMNVYAQKLKIIFSVWGQSYEDVFECVKRIASFGENTTHVSSFKLYARLCKIRIYRSDNISQIGVFYLMSNSVSSSKTCGIYETATISGLKILLPFRNTHESEVWLSSVLEKNLNTKIDSKKLKR
jgi:hypothetical protein